MEVKKDIDSDIILHIGLHKTATTWLQNEIFSKMNVEYIHDFNLSTPLKKNKVIISHEKLSGNPVFLSSATTRYVYANRLSRIFPNAKVIISFRDKKSWVSSLWKQYIIEGGTKKFEDFKKELDQDFLDYDTYLHFLKGHFKEVYSYYFEDFCKDKTKIISDICEFVDIEEPEWKDIIYRKSLSFRKTEWLRRLNCIGFGMLSAVQFKNVTKRVMKVR